MAVQDRRDRGHAERVRRHPAGARPTARACSPAGRCERSIGPMLSSPRKPPSKTFDAVLVLAVHPPGEVDEQLVEDPAQEVDVPAAVDREHLERRPRLHGRVDVVERPLVRRHGAVRVLEPLAAEQRQLVLRERRVDVRERDAVERHVPRGEPRVLPLVGHRHDVEGVEAPPAGVAALEPRGRRARLGRVAVEPALDVVVVELLAPQHSGEGLTHHVRLVVGHAGRRQLGVELVGLRAPARDARRRSPTTGRASLAAGRSRRRSSTRRAGSRPRRGTSTPPSSRSRRG